jgi:glucose-6-phosphate isomerase
MSITAARLGSSPLMFDWSNLKPPARALPGTGSAGAAYLEAWSKLKARYAAGEGGFYDSLANTAISDIDATEKMARELLAGGNFTDALFLGIGGSSLGPISLLSALKEPARLARRKKGALKITFLENPDPTEWKATIEELDPARTLVVCVAKSGTTFETMSQYLLALEWIGFDRWKTHSVAITDPVKGDLRKFATEHQIPTLAIHPSIGGRFSIFSPVGTFPGFLAGLDMREFMKGALQVREYVEKSTVDAKSAEKNPLFQIGADLIAHFERRPIHVIMPYANALKQWGAWFVQLWAESLGKDLKGFTPVSALGAVDQHSILQLLRDGPDDKVTFFLTVEKVADEVKIPFLNRIRGKFNSPTPAAFQILEGHTLHSLLRVEYQAISLVLTKRNRPNFTLHLEQIDERNLGALYFAGSVFTAFTGTLWGVDPFDQPGVEEGKIYIRESLTRIASERKTVDDSEENSAVARLRTYANRDRGESDGAL